MIPGQPRVGEFARRRALLLPSTAATTPNFRGAAPSCSRLPLALQHETYLPRSQLQSERRRRRGTLAARRVGELKVEGDAADQYRAASEQVGREQSGTSPPARLVELGALGGSTLELLQVLGGRGTEHPHDDRSGEQRPATCPAEPKPFRIPAWRGRCRALV